MDPSFKDKSQEFSYQKCDINLINMMEILKRMKKYFVDFLLRKKGVAKTNKNQGNKRPSIPMYNANVLYYAFIVSKN